MTKPLFFESVIIRFVNNYSDLDFQERKLLLSVQEFPYDDRKKITSALEFAKERHDEQKRDEGALYIIHPIRVANLLIEALGFTDTDTISAALLHDVVEDTNTNIDEIQNKFGLETARLVKNLTRIKEPDETLENRYERKLAKHNQIMKKDLKTRAIKACDYLDNMQSWQLIPKDHPSRKKFVRWFNEAEEMYIPLAETVDNKFSDLLKSALKEVRCN